MMKKAIPTPMLLALGIAAYLAACGLLTWLHFVYDGALPGINLVYFWVFGAAELLLLLCEPSDKNARPTPRWLAVVLMLLVTAALYYLIDEGSTFPTLPFRLGGWISAVTVLIALLIHLYQNSRFRAPALPAAKKTPARGVAVLLLLLYVPMLFVTPVYLAVMHPVTEDSIRAAHEDSQWQYIGTTSPTRDAPLGAYLFANSEDYRWRHYDVLTGALLQEEQPFPLT